MIYPQRKCAHCNNDFTPTRKDKKYCSRKCSFDAFKAREGEHAKVIDEPVAANEPKQPLNGLMALGTLDVASQYVITHQGDTISDLKTEIKEQKARIETLLEERRGNEKKITDLENQLSQKPSALSGLIQSDKLPDMIMAVPGMLKGVLDVISEVRKNGPQLAGAEQVNADTHPIIEWLSKQPLDIQNEFVQMVQELSQITDARKMIDTLRHMTGSAIKVSGRRAG